MNEWLESNHWYQWFYDGFWSGKPLIPMVLHWFLVWQPLVPMVFQWFCSPETIGPDGFPMVANHWSNDGMVTIHRYGLDEFIDCTSGYCSMLMVKMNSYDTV